MEVWLLILGHADYKMLKKVERISKVFQNVLIDELFDSALFRVSPENLCESDFTLHPILQSLGKHLEMWQYYMTSTGELLFATSRSALRSTYGPGENLLKAKVATESAFWPPIRQTTEVYAYINMTIMSAIEAPIFPQSNIKVQVEPGSHGYVTIKDVIETLLDSSGTLKALKSIDIDSTCDYSGKLVGLRVETMLFGYARLELDWKVMKTPKRRAMRPRA